MGESGSGKTLTSLSLLQLLPRPIAVTGGTIRLGDTELTRLAEKALRRIRGTRIAMVFQEPMTSLAPAFTIGNQRIEAVRSHDPGTSKADARARAIEVLDLVGIPAAATRLGDYPHNFSGGMRQRAMIALAITGNPEVLVADEPTTALDVTIQAQILDLLRRLQTELGMGMVVVTHDLGVVADVCDRIAVMYAGQVVETGSVGEAFAAPAHPYTAGLLAAMPQIGTDQHRLQTIPGLVPEAGRYPAGCRFAPRCDHAVDTCGSGAVPPLEYARHGGATRCLRVGELTLAGVDDLDPHAGRGAR